MDICSPFFPLVSAKALFFRRWLLWKTSLAYQLYVLKQSIVHDQIRKASSTGLSAAQLSECSIDEIQTDRVQLLFALAENALEKDFFGLDEERELCISPKSRCDCCRRVSYHWRKNRLMNMWTWNILCHNAYKQKAKEMGCKYEVLTIWMILSYIKAIYCWKIHSYLSLCYKWVM